MLLLACAGACGGGGDKAPTYTPVSATSVGSVYTLTLGDLKMVIDGSHGARITEFSFRGRNVLVTSDENINYGGTFWPSPQSSWCTAATGCWPPPAAIDNQPYTGGIDVGNSIQLVSGDEQSIAGIAGSTIAARKQFTPVPESGAIDITYTLTNASQPAGVSFAPWQVSRVEPGGLTFFGQGTGPVTYAPNTASTFIVNEMAGDFWYVSGVVSHDSKAFADGTGWIAQVTPDRLLYLVAYPDTQPVDTAPGEAEIELYTNSSYVEVEQQGALATIAPGTDLSWTVRWKLRPLPGGAAVAPGSADLMSFAASALAD
jgi:hypothetical protein